jgi:DNA (cytosine-5)-methyltransferase 1
MKVCSIAAVAFSCKQDGGDSVSDVAPTMRAMSHRASHSNGGGQLAAIVAFDTYNHTAGDVSQTLQRGTGTDQIGAVMESHAVRRLTPLECERLQGFPDGYTDVTYRSKPASDGPRYKALGNSMAVPVMAWIGKRIAMLEEAKDGTPNG